MPHTRSNIPENPSLLRFDSPTPRPRNYLLRREQNRLLALVALLGLVLLGMQQLRGPEARAFIAAVFGEDQPAAVGAAPSIEPVSIDEAAALDPGLFTEVRDNTYFRDEETSAWFATLKELQEAGSPATAAEATYAQLVSQPDAYRGKGVAIRGVARRIERVTPAENDLGIDKLYRITVQPTAGEVWPVTLYALALPEDVAPAQETSTPITATGYFFKNQSYRWQGGMGTTPVLLAAGFTAIAPPPAPEQVVERGVDPTTLFLTAGVVSLLLIGLFVIRTAGRARPKPRPGTVTIDIAEEP